MRIDSSGNVGIGTTSPAVKLQIQKGSNGEYLRVGGDDQSDGNRGLRFTSSSGASFVGAVHDINAPSSQGVIALSTSSTERMRITSSGNVGIGTDSPLSLLQLAKATIPSSITRASNYLQIGGSEEGLNGYQVIGFGYNDSGRTYMPAYIGFKQTVASSGNAGDLIFGTRADGSDVVPTERMRITSAGNVGIGTTSLSVNYRMSVLCATGAGGIIIKNATTTGVPLLCQNSAGSEIGSISTTNTATAYNTSSDYRLKEDDVPMTGATERVKALRPINFAWKSDGSRVDGFLAHEVQEIVPEAITGTKDAMRDEEYEVTPAVLDDDGNVVTEAVMGTRSVPDYQGIDQSKLVPLLTKAIQEQQTIIESLEARITALES
jgi:hypothetical protein